MKTQEELSALKEEYEAISRKLRDLTEEELIRVTGGAGFGGETGPEYGPNKTSPQIWTTSSLNH